MPPLIGEVVSDVMYDGQLQSNPKHPACGQPCVWFVHVEDSQERQFETSWHVSVCFSSYLMFIAQLEAV